MLGRRRRWQREIAQQNLAEPAAWLSYLRGDRGDMEKEAPNWVGAGGRGEHRTVGSHRAWCYLCSEWCWSYKEGCCQCCDDEHVPPRWRGENVGSVVADIRRQVEAMEDVMGRPTEAGDCLIWASAVLNLLDTGGSDGA